MEELLMQLTTKWPWVVTVVSVMGMARLVLKPLMVFFQEFVQVTPSTKDDEFLGKVMASKWYKGFVFVLDWFLSLKLPKPAKK